MSTPSQNASPATGEAEPKAPKRQRGRERVLALMEAAATLFVEKGYDATTMTEIAARASSSIGSLYQFFPTKVLLAEAMHVELLAALGAMLEGLAGELKGKSARDIGETVFERFGAFLAAAPEFAVLAARRDIPKERKAQSRAHLLAGLGAMLAEARPPIPAERIEVLAGVLLEVLVIATSGADSGDELRAKIIAELRSMLAGRLESAAKPG